MNTNNVIKNILGNPIKMDGKSFNKTKTVVYKDKAGNKIIKTINPKTGNTQYYGENADGKLLDAESLNILAKRANIKLPTLKKKPGIQKVVNPYYLR